MSPLKKHAIDPLAQNGASTVLVPSPRQRGIAARIETLEPTAVLGGLAGHIAKTAQHCFTESWRFCCVVWVVSTWCSKW